MYEPQSNNLGSIVSQLGAQAEYCRQTHLYPADKARQACTMQATHVCKPASLQEAEQQPALQVALSGAGFPTSFLAFLSIENATLGLPFPNGPPSM